MTQTELTLHTFRNNGVPCDYYKARDIDEFFSQNVVIPRGQSRHPYADALHAYAEGVTVQWDPYGTGWVDVDDYTLSFPYRIKPLEPVYEHRFACVDENGRGYISGFYGEGEEGPIGIKLIGTKRIRQ